MTRKTLKFGPALLAGVFLLSGGLGFAQSADPASSTATSQTSPNTPAASNMTRAQRRAARRRARAAQQAAQPPQPTATQVGPTAAQRRRDAQILAAQKAQSAATARENDEVTQKVVQEQQKQQAEPRIQNAPGPDSQPLPGAPAVAPTQASDPPRIQDAPGPAQTLPKAPPATPAPQP